MNKAAPSSRWFAGWRSAARPAEVDAADLGTAFGLDLSLNEIQHGPAQPAPTERRVGWMQSLAKRRKPTA